VVVLPSRIRLCAAKQDVTIERFSLCPFFAGGVLMNGSKRTVFWMFLAAILVTAFCAGDNAPAAVVTGVTIEDYSSELLGGFNRQAVHTVDGSGLVGGQHGNVPDHYMWLTKGTYQAPNDPLPARITFDLEGNYDLDSFHVWNYNEHSGNPALFTKRGANDVTISVASSEGGAFTSLGSFNFAQANGTTTYAGETIDLSPYAAADNTRLVRFDVTSSHGGDNNFAGLSEVQFRDASVASPVVPNFSFEDPAQSPGRNNSGGNGNTTAITGWTISGNGAGVFFPNGNGGLGNPLPAPADGSQYAFLETPNNNSPTSITTTAPVGTVAANTIYTLTTAIGHRNTSIRLPDNYLIELLVDGIPVASNSLLNAHTNIQASSFMDLSASFTSPSSGSLVGGAMWIRLTHATDDGLFRQGAFDNVRLTASVIPEPSTFLIWSLLAGLGVGLGWRRRK
jgi:hypothetical protein